MTVDIVAAALGARTRQDARHVQKLIAESVGAVFKRPVGDRWGNQGLLTGSGASYDHKILEVVTNMQDAVIARKALVRYKTSAAVPYSNPHAAANDLLKGVDPREQAKLAKVTIDHGTTLDPEKRGKRPITIVCRDQGIGIGPAAIPETIFQIGSSAKDGVDWQQGVFGMGGATTLRNVSSAVLVTRTDPALLEDGEDDRIAVAVVEWEPRSTTLCAYYLTTTEWKKPGDRAVPYSVAASAYPYFEPGTHLALIDYHSEGLGVRSGDQRSFDTVLNTRLYRPVTAVGYQNNTTREAPRMETLSGLEGRLDRNPGDPGTEGRETMAFVHSGSTYQLPVRFRIFNKGDKGARRRFVAQGHVLVMTSNGQVHAHWDQSQFQHRTTLSKLPDRIFVAVETDALPVGIRTEMFTADRTQLVQSSAAMRLEKEIVTFLNEWPTLREANNALIREAIKGDSSGLPTLDVAQKISRALNIKGFSLGGSGTGGGGPKPPEPTPAKDLFDDPTNFTGPTQITAVQGKNKGVFFQLNATDDFFSHARGELLISCDHPEIGADEIAIGELRSGRIRVSVAVPEDFEGMYKLEAHIPEWSKASGGLGDPFHHTVKLEVVHEAKPHPTGNTGAGAGSGHKGADQGGLVALVWTSDNEREDWTPKTVGEVEMVPAADLASRQPEYKDLAGLGVDIPTVVLNSTYSHLKNYISARAADLSDTGRQQARNRYAIGVGVALLVQDEERRRADKAGHPVSDDTLAAGADAAARGILAVMPAYDQLAKEAGYED